VPETSFVSWCYVVVSWAGGMSEEAQHHVPSSCSHKVHFKRPSQHLFYLCGYWTNYNYYVNQKANTQLYREKVQEELNRKHWFSLITLIQAAWTGSGNHSLGCLVCLL